MNKVGKFIANGVLLTFISLLIRTVSVIFTFAIFFYSKIDFI